MSGEKKGFVGIVEVRSGECGTLIAEMYWHGRREGEVDNDNEGEGGVAEYRG